MTGCEVAVIGAGVIGLAVADELRQRGVDVMCIDHAVPGSGKSRGVVRIFRHRHASVEEIERAVVARRLWDEWSAQAGRALIGPEEHLYVAPDAPQVHERLRRAGVRASLQEAGAIMAQWRALAIDGAGVIEHDGGAIRAAETVAFLRARLADRVRAGHVHAIDADGRIDSDRMLQAEQVVIAAGVGTWDLAGGAGIDLPLVLSPHLRLTFPLGVPLPTMSIRTAHAGLYAAPTPDGRAVTVGVVGSSDAAEIHGALTALLPGIDHDVQGELPCVQTSSTDGDDALFLHRRGAVMAVTGGNMFKWTPLVARDVADALL